VRISLTGNASRDPLRHSSRVRLCYASLHALSSSQGGGTSWKCVGRCICRYWTLVPFCSLALTASIFATRPTRGLVAKTLTLTLTLTSFVAVTRLVGLVPSCWRLTLEGLRLRFLIHHRRELACRHALTSQSHWHTIACNNQVPEDQHTAPRTHRVTRTAKTAGHEAPSSSTHARLTTSTRPP
jgi:hypothetical protein